MDIEMHQYYRHKKTGGIYFTMFIGRIEATLERVVTYRKVDPETWNIVQDEEHTWVRPVTEFCDGRFETLQKNRSHNEGQ